MGMDNRIKDYKERIWKPEGEQGKYDTPFIELNALRELERDPNLQRTPPGYNNVASYFGK